MADMRGPAAKLHDCGEHGRLTAYQIAGKAGVHETTIYRRIRLGVRGADLCLPRLERKRAASTACYRGESIRTMGHVGIAVAVTIARAWPTRPPTVQELRNRFEMSRATAFRWRAAFVDAMGLAK